MARPKVSVSRFLTVCGFTINLEQITYIETHGVGANVHFGERRSVSVDVPGLKYLLRRLDMADEER